VLTRKGVEYLPYVVVGGEAPLPATFLLNSFLSKHAPLTTLIPDSDAELNEETEFVMQFVRGASFDKKEFKRNVGGSGAYPPTTTVHMQHGSNCIPLFWMVARIFSYIILHVPTYLGKGGSPTFSD
jgi:hypothetical protein